VNRSIANRALGEIRCKNLDIRITHQRLAPKASRLISGDNSVVAPPVPIPNTEVKRCSPDGSTAIGRARVGRRQNKDPGELIIGVFAFCCRLLEQKTRRVRKRWVRPRANNSSRHTQIAVATTRSNSGAQAAPVSGAKIAALHDVRFPLLPKSRLARHGVNRLPFFWAKLNFPSRHVFLQVRER
jgi:hypothetical protein